MSRSTIILIVTWVLIALAGAFFAGYYWEKRRACNIDNPAGGATVSNVQSNGVTPPATTSVTANPASGNNNGIITQPGGGGSITPPSSGTNRTVAPPAQPK